MQVVAEASDGEETVTNTRKSTPDIVLMDITMPGLTGSEATREIKKTDPETKVLVLTMHEDENYLYQMLNAGADSYVPKKAADTELLAAIRATYRGEHFIHSSMTDGLLSHARGKPVNETFDRRKRDLLSQRETEVLRLLAMGYTNQQIADKLYLSVRTVETYKARLKEKLGAKGRADLVRYAIETGHMDLEA